MKKIKPPELEIGLGLETYKSRSRGIGGRIKTNPEDFIVEEIIKDKRVLEIDSEMNFPVGDEKEYLHFTLQKTNWDTLRAIREISNRLGISKKRLNFAGTKDKRAITTQRVSVWKKTIEDLKKVGIKDIILRDFQYSDKRINLGDLWGNRFTVVIRDTNLGVNEIRERINRIEIELDGKMPNYFGVQRFGTTRPITHLVGREILKCNFEEAVMI
ncbi:MAG TPA: tRNA pseudouridine(13) synthase TruD, partial [Candidatus Altiarchaeales archaeon]|nr:tRNA pseudouridine(13) synthase TruD [Candidatus Altiarchaeales archaeon]